MSAVTDAWRSPKEVIRWCQYHESAMEKTICEVWDLTCRRVGLDPRDSTMRCQPVNAVVTVVVQP